MKERGWGGERRPPSLITVGRTGIFISIYSFVVKHGFCHAYTGYILVSPIFTPTVQQYQVYTSLCPPNNVSFKRFLRPVHSIYSKPSPIRFRTTSFTVALPPWGRGGRLFPSAWYFVIYLLCVPPPTHRTIHTWKQPCPGSCSSDS